MQIRHEVEVERPPEVVFDFLIDTDSFRVVDRALVSYTPGGLMHVGLSGAFVHRRGGVTARSTWRSRSSSGHRAHELGLDPRQEQGRQR